MSILLILRLILLTTLSINIPHFPFCTTLLKLQNFHLLIELTNQCPGSGPYLLTSSVLRFSPKLCITELSSEEEINLNNKIYMNMITSILFLYHYLTRQRLGQKQRKLVVFIIEKLCKLRGGGGFPIILSGGGIKGSNFSK